MRQIPTLEKLRSERVRQPSRLWREVHFAPYHAAEPPFNPSVKVGPEYGVHLTRPRP